MPAVADEAVGQAVGEFFSRPYDLLLGRRTYDIFAAYWPYVTGEDAAMGDAFTAAAKYVLTRREQPLTWENSHRLRGIDDVAALKQGDGPDLLIQGSSTEHYNEVHPHRSLGYKSPREFIAFSTSEDPSGL